MNDRRLQMASSSSSTQRSRKKMKRNRQSHGPDQPIEWQSNGQQQFYSSKLLQALRRVRLAGSPSAGPRRVHEAADRVLAAIAKGRSRWSRAILNRRLKVKHLRKKNNIATRESKITTVVTGYRNSRSRKLKCVLRLKKKNLPAVHRKVKVLGRLVPGCRKQPLPVVLEEATDYIAALEMQVKAMSALAERLSLYSSSSSGSSTGLSEPRSSPNSHT